MMNMLEEAVIYATAIHHGKVRKFNGIPYILHPKNRRNTAIKKVKIYENNDF